jgi:hypothetical protein
MPKATLSPRDWLKRLTRCLKHFSSGRYCGSSYHLRSTFRKLQSRLKRFLHQAFLGLASSALANVKIALRADLRRDSSLIDPFVQFNCRKVEKPMAPSEPKKRAPDFSGALSDSRNRSNGSIVLVVVGHCRSFFFLLRLIGDHRLGSNQQARNRSRVL